MKFNFLEIKKTAKALADRLHDLGREVEHLRAERSRLEQALAAKTDMKQALGSWVRARAASFEPTLAAQLERLAARPADFDNPSAARGLFSLSGQPNDPDALTSTGQLDAMLCACFPSLVLPLLMQSGDAGRWDEGPTNAARRERIDAIDDRVRKASAEIKELRSQAAESGLDV